MTRVFEVCVPVASLHRKGSRRSPLETQLIYGETFNAADVQRGWARGQAQSPITSSSFPGYAGYIQVKFLRPVKANPNMIVTALAAPVFKTADIKSPVQTLWPMNARFSGAPEGDFIETEAGFVHHRHARSLDKAPAVTDFVTIAEQYLGRPYIWGGVSSEGLDCSGLVQASLRAIGQDTPRDSGDQAQLGEGLTEDAPLKRGDLIFWKGHVGIMQDGSSLLHANAYHMAVASEPLGTAIARITESGGPVMARRRIKGLV